MTVSTTDLALDPDIGAFVDLLEQKAQDGQYVRIRRIPLGGNPWAVGQIRDLSRDAFLEELAQRLGRIKSTDPIELQWMRAKGNTVIDSCDVQPMLEVMQQAYNHRMELAKVEGESQVVIAAMTILGNVLMSERREATKERKENRILFQRISEIRSEVKIAELVSDLGLRGLMDELENEEGGDSSFWDSPTIIKAMDTFSATLGIPIGELGKLFRVLAERVQRTNGGTNRTPPPDDPPRDDPPRDDPPPDKPPPDKPPLDEDADFIDVEVVEVKPGDNDDQVDDQAAHTSDDVDETGDAETGDAETGDDDDSDDAPTDDELSDTVVEWLDYLLEHAPEKLATPERLETLRKHKARFRVLMALLDAAEDLPPEPDEKPKDASSKKKKAPAAKKKAPAKKKKKGDGKPKDS